MCKNNKVPQRIAQCTKICKYVTKKLILENSTNSTVVVLWTQSLPVYILIQNKSMRDLVHISTANVQLSSFLKQILLVRSRLPQSELFIENSRMLPAVKEQSYGGYSINHSCRSARSKKYVRSKRIYLLQACETIVLSFLDRKLTLCKLLGYTISVYQVAFMQFSNNLLSVLLSE